MALSGAGNILSGFVLEISANRGVLLFGIAMIYVVLGMFLDPMGAMLITLPILLPIAHASGFDLIWFGVIIAELLEVGMITPVGLNVFVIKSVVDRSISLATIFRGVVVFLVADAAVLILLMAYPDIVLFLPRMLD